ncbi:MAG: valine--pyruvate transaminase [Lentisphaeria bacterium]
MRLSNFGKRYAGKIGISELMDDLGNALSGERPMLMLGGGNPSHIPGVQELFRTRMEHIMEKPGEFERVIGDYDTPQGDKVFVEALAELFKNEFGWDIGPQNIALTNGSQNSFFLLFNIFAGRFDDNRLKRVLLPLAPEYIGYADVGLEADFFRASRPDITRLSDHMFKYHVDFDRVAMTDDIGAVCVSRPTNPTGNVLTDAEVATLSRLTEDANVPLIIDNAYGTPFPNIIYEDVKPVWNPNTVVCMSLSKLGLPGLRTGIVVADEEIIRVVSRMTAVFSLAPGSMGAAVALDMVRSGEITRISRDLIRPYYKQKAEHAVAHLMSEMDDLPIAVHKPEGALFLWLWFEGLPISSTELYERLKARGVLVVPGRYFFPGLEHDDWPHRHECIRVTYAQDDAVVEQGLSIIVEEIGKIYSGQGKKQRT